MDSVRAAGLPAGALADRAAEGVLKGADDQRILTAVRVLARELGEARTVLGAAADPALLTATASALHAGASAADLRRLVRPNGAASIEAHTLATALVTLVDLVAKRIPAPAATNAVGELLKRRVTDDQFVVLRSEVEQDIRGGVAPEAALTKRIRSHVELLDAPPVSARPIRPATIVGWSPSDETLPESSSRTRARHGPRAIRRSSPWLAIPGSFRRRPSASRS